MNQPTSGNLTPGGAVAFYSDNKLYHAICLAVIGDEVLIEYRKTNRCSLFVGRVQNGNAEAGQNENTSNTIIVGDLKSCNYRSVPKRWLQQMISSGQTWKGLERGGTIAPSPVELLKGQMELF